MATVSYYGHCECCISISKTIPSQVAGRTNDAAGDGTTTASVLAREMILYGLQVEYWDPLLHFSRTGSDTMPQQQAVTSGANPIAVKKGIDKTCEFLVDKLRQNVKPVKGTDDIKVHTQLFCDI